MHGVLPEHSWREQRAVADQRAQGLLRCDFMREYDEPFFDFRVRLLPTDARWDLSSKQIFGFESRALSDAEKESVATNAKLNPDDSVIHAIVEAASIEDFSVRVSFELADAPPEAKTLAYCEFTVPQAKALVAALEAAIFMHERITIAKRSTDPREERG